MYCGNVETNTLICLTSGGMKNKEGNNGLSNVNQITLVHNHENNITESHQMKKEDIELSNEDQNATTFTTKKKKNEKKATWESIKPIVKVYSNNRKIRRMGGRWTEVIQDKINQKYPGCVLVFKTHHVKSGYRKKCTPFVVVSASCKGNACNATFKCVIDTEPPRVFEEGFTITIECTVNGHVQHYDDEVNRRPITGK